MFVCWLLVNPRVMDWFRQTAGNGRSSGEGRQCESAEWSLPDMLGRFGGRRLEGSLVVLLGFLLMHDPREVRRHQLFPALVPALQETLPLTGLAPDDVLSLVTPLREGEGEGERHPLYFLVHTKGSAELLDNAMIR